MGAILASASRAQQGQRIEQSPLVLSPHMASPSPAMEATLSPKLLEVAPDSITKPILVAIEGFKVMMMVHIDHLASKCTLIHHDLDKIRGRLTEAEDWIGKVEDQQGSQASQIVDLSSLVHKVDDAKTYGL